MPATTDEVRELLSDRLTELDDEKARVQRALEALGSTNGRRPGPSKRRRRRRSGTRSEEALSMIVAKPGITASEIARAMKIKSNYLYRVLKDLEKEGKVKKTGRSYEHAGMTIRG